MTPRPGPSSAFGDENWNTRCLVAPSPALQTRLRERLARLRAAPPAPGLRVGIQTPKRPGFNDGLIIPGSEFPLGTSLRRVRRAAAERAPLRGNVRVIVVLADFADEPMQRTREQLQDLFFSTGKIAKGSVREYFTDVSNGKIKITGQVVGPYRLPRTLAAYAGGGSGTDNPAPNARTMARDAAVLANADVDFAPYDNDDNGFVDAFIVVHAGPGAEETGDGGHIWSHKWVLSGGAFAADGAQIYAYLTVPEDCRIGVCAHELGHLLFGWPDLYDTDETSEGLGDFCLMAGGSWNDGGDLPAHPSAWCKVDQGWVTVVTPKTNRSVQIKDVKTGKRVYRLWKDGGANAEYFLVENRQRKGYDADLPGAGLFIYHVDEAIDENDNENHPKVKLMEADGRNQLHNGSNRGDGGDPFPGTSGNVAFTSLSLPSSKSYGDRDSCVTVTGIGASAATMRARLGVRCATATPKKKKKKTTTTKKTTKTTTKKKKTKSKKASR